MCIIIVTTALSGIIFLFLFQLYQVKLKREVMTNDHQKPNWNIIGTESKLSASPLNYQPGVAALIDNIFCIHNVLYYYGESPEIERDRKTERHVMGLVCLWCSLCMINWWVHLHLSERRDKGSKEKTKTNLPLHYFVIVVSPSPEVEWRCVLCGLKLGTWRDLLMGRL